MLNFDEKDLTFKVAQFFNIFSINYLVLKNGFFPCQFSYVYWNLELPLWSLVVECKRESKEL